MAADSKLPLSVVAVFLPTLLLFAQQQPKLSIGNAKPEELPWTVHGHVEWFASDSRQGQGISWRNFEARIDPKGSVLLADTGNFAFDFSTYGLSPGEKIHVHVRDTKRQDLVLVLPLGGDTEAPPKDMTDWTWKVLLPQDQKWQIAPNDEILSEFVGRATLRHPFLLASNSCGPDGQDFAWVADNTRTTQYLGAITHALSARGFVEGASDEEHCQAWRTEQVNVLNRKLNINTTFLKSNVGSNTESLTQLYEERAAVRSRLATIHLTEGQYVVATDELQRALADLEHAPEAKAAKADVEKLYETAKQRAADKK